MNSTVYNEKLKQAYITTNYVSKKKKYKRVKIEPQEKHRGEVGCSAKMLSKGTIPQYFYMPIAQAAKEPDEGPAVLKKRCREHLASG